MRFGLIARKTSKIHSDPSLRIKSMTTTKNADLHKLARTEVVSYEVLNLLVYRIKYQNTFNLNC